MKSIVRVVVVAAVLAGPAVSFAQSSDPVTRAQVRAELVQLENAGYQPGGGEDVHYPDNLLAAEARVAAQNRASGVGGVANGSSNSGHPAGSRPD